MNLMIEHYKDELTTDINQVMEQYNGLVQVQDKIVQNSLDTQKKLLYERIAQRSKQTNFHFNSNDTVSFLLFS